MIEKRKAGEAKKAKEGKTNEGADPKEPTKLSQTKEDDGLPREEFPINVRCSPADENNSF